MQDRAGMEGPGLSLFQGSEGIQLNVSAQHLQDEEEQEDLKRRNEEIKDLLTNAFDDLEDDDDVSSMNSSHFHDATRDADRSSFVDNSVSQPNAKGQPTLSHFQNEFGIYGQNDSRSYNEHSSLNETEPEKGPTISDIQREYGLYQSAGTPYSNNNKGGNSTERTAESPYELPRPPSSGFQREIRPEVSECYTLDENYAFNHETPGNHYETPANHYEGKGKNYPNNGYIGLYENNIQNKEYSGGGGGDNDVGSEHYNHCYKTSPNGRPLNDNTAYKTAEYNSKEQLEVLYSVRMREIQRLTEELEQLHLSKEEEKDQLGRQLALAQAETERSNLSRNQAQNALVDAKAEIADLQTQVSSLKENVAVLEKTNQNLSQELTIAKDSVIDLQQKIAVLERVQTLHASDKTHEKFLKQAQEKHAIEMRNMQTQLDVLADKLTAKESSYVALEHKLADVRRAHENMLVEKGDTMNRLSQALEESQARCQNLMANNNAQESMQLQARVKMLTQEKDELQKSVQELQHKLEMAKNDAMQYDSLLATSLEDESDSIRQLKLGELHNRSRGKGADDIANKLRGELQRCLAGQAVKRKEINRLENTLAQKDKELAKAMEMASTCQREAARYAKRVNELEHELKAVLTEHTVNANAQIQKLSDHLTDVKTHYEELREEKELLEQKLEETLANQNETLRKLHQENVQQQEKEIVDEYNKEYLEIHEKAVERVRQESQREIVQLTVQLEQTQKELVRVKELYIDVCGTKEQLISEHKNEIRLLKEQYSSLEAQRDGMEKLRNELETQVKIVERLTKECEAYKAEIVELEKDLSNERQKEEYRKKIHEEIEITKEKARAEIRKTQPDHQTSLMLPDRCSEHLDKIARLEDDCKRLEEKLSVAVADQRNMSDLQSDLNDARLKVAQMEIAQESLRKKHDKVSSERNDLVSRISKLEAELSEARNSKRQSSEDVEQKMSRMQLENDALRKKNESLLKEKNEHKEQITRLAAEIAEKKKTVANLESILSRNSENATGRAAVSVEKELSRYKELVEQLTMMPSDGKDKRTADLFLEERVKQLEMDLQSREERLNKLKEDRDLLVAKLKNQAKHFEQYLKSQKQVSAELNLSPRSSIEDADALRQRNDTIKKFREEMEQKVAEERRAMEEQHREREKDIEAKHERAVFELQARCSEMAKEIESMNETKLAEKMKLLSSFKASVHRYNQELRAREMKIKELQEELGRRENDVEEDRNAMALMTSEWIAELRTIKANEDKMNEEINRLKEVEKSLTNKIKSLEEKEEQMKNSICNLKQQYQSARLTVQNWKKHAKNKEALLNEHKRYEEDFKTALKQVQKKYDAIIDEQEERVAAKLKDVESQYDERLKQMRLKMKYKGKC